MQLDATGKASFDHIYVQPDPRDYFSTLRGLDYCIPELAKPIFSRLIRQHQQSVPDASTTVLDVGCSYGINAALLKCDISMDDLHEHYCGDDAGAATRSERLTRDQTLVQTRNQMPNTRFVGLDVSQPALAYAASAGFLDDAVHADLEHHDPSEGQRQKLTDVDLVISTGCIGYVTDRTIARIVAAQGDRRPPMAHFVLRMFPFEPFAESLAGLGYDTVRFDGMFRQRRFASAQEQAVVLDRLSTAGVDPSGLEADGWLYAQLFLCRPKGSDRPAVHDLTANGTLHQRHPHVRHPRQHARTNSTADHGMEP
ncbi:MAG: class I SAM-dependent methyltransferase [Frankia sp.]